MRVHLTWVVPFSIFLASCGGGGSGSSSSPISCTPSGGVAFSGKSFSFNLPTGIAVDANNNVWVTNTGGNTVTELPASNPNAPIVYSSNSFHFDLPADVAIDGTNNVWITNLNNASVTEIPSGSPNSPIVYSSKFTSPFFPLGIAVDGNNIWIANKGDLSGNGSLTEITSSGTVTNTDIDMADVKPLEQKNHAVSLDTTKHTVSTGFPHVPFFSDS